MGKALNCLLFLVLSVAGVKASADGVAQYTSPEKYEETFDQLVLNAWTDKVSQVIDITGHFHLRDKPGIEEFITKLRTDQNVLVIRMRNFRGGYDLTGDAFRAAINAFADANNVTIITFAPPQDVCKSMCVELFMMGEIRLAAPSAIFGFHAGRITQKDGSFKSNPKFAMDNLKAAGVNPQWLKTHRDLFKNYQVMTDINARDLEDSNLITHLIHDQFQIDHLIPDLVQQLHSQAAN